MSAPAWLSQYVVADQPASWEDVIGLTKAKLELGAVVARLRHPEAILAAGGRASPGGVLVWGPPGNGKTTLCRALVADLRRTTSVECFAIPAADLSPARFGELGRYLAGELDGMVVIYIDEIDAAWARPRGTQQRLGTLAAALAVMDGLDQRARGRTLWLGSSSTSPQGLDSALVRPGRLGFWVKVPAPARALREQAFAKWLGQVRLGEEIDVARAARITGSGTSYADIRQAIEDSVAIAIAEEGPEAGVRWRHVRAALARMGRIEDEPLISDPARVAAHEAGHYHAAIELGVPVDSVTTTPRDGEVRVSEGIVRTTKNLRALLAATLAGAEAERLVMGDVLEAGSDLWHATELAMAVVEAGDGPWQPVSLAWLPKGPAMADQLYGAVQQVMVEERARARALVTARRSEIEELAVRLRASGDLVPEEIRLRRPAPRDD